MWSKVSLSVSVWSPVSAVRSRSIWTLFSYAWTVREDLLVVLVQPQVLAASPRAWLLLLIMKKPMDNQPLQQLIRLGRGALNGPSVDKVKKGIPIGSHWRSIHAEKAQRT